MTKTIIEVQGFPVKIYTSADNKTAHVFPLFGRYYTLRSDTNVMDFATTFLLARNGNVVSFASYQSSGEDTQVIQIEKVAA